MTYNYDYYDRDYLAESYYDNYDFGLDKNFYKSINNDEDYMYDYY